jgi:hypothetical protein
MPARSVRCPSAGGWHRVAEVAQRDGIGIPIGAVRQLILPGRDPFAAVEALLREMSFKSAQFKPGWKGGPGRPAGSRDRLQAAGRIMRRLPELREAF